MKSKTQRARNGEEEESENPKRPYELPDRRHAENSAANWIRKGVSIFNTLCTVHRGATEHLAGLEQQVLMSETFVEQVSMPTVCHGSFELKGLKETVRIYGLTVQYMKGERMEGN